MVWLAAAEVGCLGGFDFRLSGSGASASAAETQWQAGWPPGRRPKASGPPPRAQGIRVADSLWVAQERPGAVGWIMTRTAGPLAAEPPLAAHRGGCVTGRCRQLPAAVLASDGPQGHLSAGLASFGSVSRQAAWSVH